MNFRAGGASGGLVLRQSDVADEPAFVGELPDVHAGSLERTADVGQWADQGQVQHGAPLRVGHCHDLVPARHA
jgi:hypothetical protein